MRAYISGTGSYLPARVMTNEEVCRRAPTTDAWIREKLGIETRRIAAPDEQASDMGTAAARQALAAAGLGSNDLDAILCALGTGDVVSPATAGYIQHKLGVTNQCMAMDIRAACAGGISGIQLGRSLITAGMARHVLVVGTQLGSRTAVDWSDRLTAGIFGDGAGAAVVSATQDATRGILAGRVHTDGSLTGIVGQYAGGSVEPLTAEVLKTGRQFIRMDGKAVWACAERVLPQVVGEVLQEAGLSLSDVDFVVAHQANRRMLLHILGLMGMDATRTHTNVEHYGNTVAASALIALDESVRQGHVRPGKRVVMMAIGAGMTWGALAMRW
ncbi:MAG: ketoacyl-ACP synthase III [Deltaproteobacteria bacterium]|nr:ketoacyl-ACP synthase III [Deltaproteobacteria bacterium]